MLVALNPLIDIITNRDETKFKMDPILKAVVDVYNRIDLCLKAEVFSSVAVNGMAVKSNVGSNKNVLLRT